MNRFISLARVIVMLRRFFLAVTLITYISTFIGCGGGSSSLPGLDAPKTFTLYSIDGRDFPADKKPKTDEQFRGYPVLGKVEITDRAKHKELASALEAGIAKGEDMAKCFWPRHAIRVTSNGRTIDYVICFECKQVEIYDNKSESRNAIASNPQSVFDKQLTDAGIALGPK